MPRNLHTPKRLLALAAVVAAAFATAPTAASAATCTIGSTSQSFARFGDPGWYFLAPGGAFEGSLTWQKSGSVALVAGNEPFLLAGKSHKTSLRLRSGGSVTTPKLCVSPELPHLRFMAKSSGSGQLDVEVRVYGSNGEVTDSSSGGISPSDHLAWAPSRLVSLKRDKFAAGETGLVTVTFKSQGDWLVDDVLVDPYRR
jgi:hypothetical protein